MDFHAVIRLKGVCTRALLNAVSLAGNLAMENKFDEQFLKLADVCYADALNSAVYARQDVRLFYSGRALYNEGMKVRRVVELLHHFCCKKCKKWWSIGDAPINKHVWFCPWCGTENNYQSKNGSAKR